MIVLVLCGGALGAMFVVRTMASSYELRINELESKIALNTVKVFVAMEDIAYGQVITNEMVYQEEQLMSCYDAVFTVDDIGSVAKMSIPAGTVLLGSMVTEHVKTPSEREVEFTCFYVPSNTVQGNYIDVRIRFQNGEDYVVLSKKRVERLSVSGETCFLMVTEEEQQIMSSAIIDAARNNALVYATVYPQPEIQDATAVNYPFRAETGALLTSMANLAGEEFYYDIQAREELEKRLKEFDSSQGNYSVIDISNLTGHKGESVANTNGEGSSISSDYENK